ncbi:hypothetical protein WG902_07225 [Ramlibacter sp. PS3R-8]|uniref:hypothetical protein n=1 Tax=Ramlibacter sp. PS3R-8 TaxID=3133437 RepID=UPI0030B31CDD
MCHLVREHPASVAEAGSSTPTRVDPRARWAGAVTAALIGGLALAALDAPRPPEPSVQVREAASAVPVAARSSVLPTAALERSALPADDGIPSASDTAKASAGGCEHGM